MSMAMPACWRPRRYEEQSAQAIQQGAKDTEPEHEMKRFCPILNIARAVPSHARSLADLLKKVMLMSIAPNIFMP
jgi:transcription initiation factor TFIIIB Brf1 subunit/transcription initiation factor TFIIB